MLASQTYWKRSLILTNDPQNGREYLSLERREVAQKSVYKI